MGWEKLLSKIEDYMARQNQAAPQPARRKPARGKQLGPQAKIAVRTLSASGRPVAVSGKVPFWQMRGYRQIPSSLPGITTWRGPLATRYGQVIAEIESSHPGQYRIFITNLPAHLHGHPCLPKTGKRWEMHVHGSLHSLGHVIFAAEQELEQHWNWQG